jgi:hypothetical protein
VRDHCSLSGSQLPTNTIAEPMASDPKQMSFPAQDKDDDVSSLSKRRRYSRSPPWKNETLLEEEQSAESKIHPDVKCHISQVSEGRAGITCR